MKHQTMGDRIKTMEKILEYLLRQKLYADYIRTLDEKSGYGTTYFPTTDDWDKYYDEHRGYILNEGNTTE